MKHKKVIRMDAELKNRIEELELLFKDGRINAHQKFTLQTIASVESMQKEYGPNAYERMKSELLK